MQTEINQENINKVKSNSMNYLINLKVKSNELKKYKFKKNPFVINQHLEKIPQILILKKCFETNVQVVWNRL